MTPIHDFQAASLFQGERTYNLSNQDNRIYSCFSKVSSQRFRHVQPTRSRGPPEVFVGEMASNRRSSINHQLPYLKAMSRWTCNNCARGTPLSCADPNSSRSRQISSPERKARVPEGRAKHLPKLPSVTDIRAPLHLTVLLL